MKNSVPGTGGQHAQRIERGQSFAHSPVETDYSRENLTGDPYFTDGLRLLVLLSETHRGLNEIQQINWERGGAR